MPDLSMRTERRAWLLGATALAAWPLAATATTPGRSLEVWKDPNCGCCVDWITHVEKAGFVATVFDQGNNAARRRLGMPAKYGSCHTALVGGYVIEGHVPAADIERLLREAPSALGLAVPGMPIGSPGMDGPEYGGRRDRYQVLLIRKDGSADVFNTHS